MSPGEAEVIASASVRKFRFLRRFLVMIVVVIPLVTGLTAYFTAETFRAEILAETRQYAVDVAANVFYHIDKIFLGRPGEGKELAPVVDPEQLSRLDEIVQLSTHHHRVERLYFFGLDGRIIYSTLHEHIGRLVSNTNEHFRKAASGEVSSAVRLRKMPLDVSQEPTAIDLLETYVPVSPQGGGRPVGVVEVYQEMSMFNRGVRRSRREVAAAALISMCVLGGFFAIITIRADRVLQAQEGKLLASNQALRDLSTDLEKQVEQRTRQLIQQEKLASIGVLAAGVAHEINNPLATIGACADGCVARFSDGRLPEKEAGEVRHYLEIINEEVFRCKRITENLLSFSRQRAEAVYELIDLRDLVQKTVELASLAPDGKKATWIQDLCAEPASLYCDSSQIRQVLYNLVSNSLAAVRSEPEPAILLRVGRSDGAVHLECMDNGVGIPIETRGEVFQPFFTTKPPGEGTGLGLSVAYGIVQRHAGSIEILPPEGAAPHPRWRWRVGARVRVSLPRATSMGAPAHLPAGPVSSSSGDGG